MNKPMNPMNKDAIHPWWLIPRYRVARPVIGLIAAIIGTVVAYGAARLLPAGTPAVRLLVIAALVTIATDEGLRTLRFRLMAPLERDIMAIRIAQLGQQPTADEQPIEKGTRRERTTREKAREKDDILFRTVAEFMVYRTRQRLQRLRAAEWADARTFAEAQSTPACPTWCEQEPGHPYSAGEIDESTGEVTFWRYHEAEMSKSPDTEHARGARVHLIQYEYGPNQAVRVDSPLVSVDAELDDPHMIRELAKTLNTLAGSMNTSDGDIA